MNLKIIKNYYLLNWIKVCLSPKARESALIDYIKNCNNTDIYANNKLDLKNYDVALSSPNNILGIEYLKALKKYNSLIKPICVKRFESEYNSIDFQMILQVRLLLEILSNLIILMILKT